MAMVTYGLMRYAADTRGLAVCEGTWYGGAHLGREAALGGQVDDKHRLALEGVHVEVLAVDVLQREGQQGGKLEG